MSRTLQGRELHYPPVEKEATAIIEAVRKWRHFLAGRHFTLVTDQRSVAFMIDNRKRSKIKNNKIQSWRLELASFSYTVKYRPGKDNVAPGSFARAFIASMSTSRLSEIHNELGHPGVTRMLHFVRTKNMPFSTEDVREKVFHMQNLCWAKTTILSSNSWNTDKVYAANGATQYWPSKNRCLQHHGMHTYSQWWMSIHVSLLHFHARTCTHQRWSNA